MTSASSRFISDSPNRISGFGHVMWLFMTYPKIYPYCRKSPNFKDEHSLTSLFRQRHIHSSIAPYALAKTLSFLSLIVFFHISYSRPQSWSTKHNNHHHVRHCYPYQPGFVPNGCSSSQPLIPILSCLAPGIGQTECGRPCRKSEFGRSKCLGPCGPECSSGQSKFLSLSSSLYLAIREF